MNKKRVNNSRDPITEPRMRALWDGRFPDKGVVVEPVGNGFAVRPDIAPVDKRTTPGPTAGGAVG